MPTQAAKSAFDALLPFLLAFWFGQNAETDRYFFSQSIFLFVLSLLSGMFQDSAIVPVLADVEEKDRNLYEKTLGALFGYVSLFGIGLGLLFFFSSGIYDLWRPSPIRHTLTFYLSFAIWAPLIGLRSFYSGVLQAKGNLSLAPLASTLGTFCAILLLFIFHTKLGITIVPVAQVISESIGLAFIAWYTARKNKVYWIRFTPNLTQPEPLKRLFKLVSSEILGASCTRINPIIDQMFVTSISGAGAITSLKYTSDIANIPVSLAQASLFPVLMVVFSKKARSSDSEGFRYVTMKLMIQLLALCLGLCLALYLFRIPLLKLLFLRGKTELSSVLVIADLLPWALLNVIPFSMMLFFVRTVVSMGGSKIMLPMGLLNAAINIAADALFTHFFGLYGILLATALTHTILAIILYYAWKRYLRRPPTSSFFSSLLLLF